MSSITQKDLDFVKDQARRSLEKLTGRLEGMSKDISDGDRLALAYIEGVVSLLCKKGVFTANTVPLKVELLEGSSTPQSEDYL